MLLLITLLVFLVMFIVLYLVLSAYLPARGLINLRLKALDLMTQGRTDIDAEMAKSFARRILSPLLGDIAAALMRFTPYSIRHLVEEKLAMAGGFGGMGTDQFLLLCGFLAIAFPVITAFFTEMAGLPAQKVFSLSLLAFIAGLALPLLLLQQKITKRKHNIQKDLPDALDLLTVSVEAGLGFDGALARLSEKMKGELVDEFTRVLQEIRMGIPRREAFAAMGTRCDVPDLSLFTASLVQADQLGVSIGQVLRVQSADMREKRKQRAEEQAMKAPVKMLLPLVLFIFPTIFIVLLGPAVIQVMTTFNR